MTELPNYVSSLGKRRRIESSKSSESESNVSKKEKAAVNPTASGSKGTVSVIDDFYGDNAFMFTYLVFV